MPYDRNYCGLFYCPGMDDTKSTWIKPRHASALKGMEGVIKMNKEQLMKLNLQMFAENTPAEENEDTTNEETPPADEPEKKYSDADVDEIVKKKLAKAKREKDEAIKEAEKLAKMNADEKKEYELKKLQDELAELKKKDAFYGLSKEATKMLSEHDITANDDLLAFVVKDDAEATKQAVDSFVTMFNEQVQEGVKKALSGKTPKVNTNAGQALTKQQILEEKDATKRIKMIQDNPHLFN